METRRREQASTDCLEINKKRRIRDRKERVLMGNGEKGSNNGGM